MVFLSEDVGKYSRLLIVLIGKPGKVNDIKVYTDFIESRIRIGKVDAIYAFGDVKNKKSIKKVCEYFKDDFEYRNSDTSKTELKYRDGQTRLIDQYYQILRKKDQDIQY